MMRELAEGFATWSGILLFFFYVYQISTNENAHFFSWKTLALIVGGECSFVIVTRLMNMLVAAITATIASLLMLKGKLELAQNFTNTSLAIFGELPA